MPFFGLLGGSRGRLSKSSALSVTNLAPTQQDEDDDFVNPFGCGGHRKQNDPPSASGSSTASGDTTSVCGNLASLWYDDDFHGGGSGAYDNVTLRDDDSIILCNTRRHWRRRRRNTCLLVSAALAVVGSVGFVVLIVVHRKGVSAPFSVSMESEGDVGHQVVEEEEEHATPTMSPAHPPSTFRQPSSHPTDTLIDAQVIKDGGDQDSSCPAGFAKFSLDVMQSADPRSTGRSTGATIKIQTLRAVDIMRAEDRYEVAFQGGLAEQLGENQGGHEFCLRTYKCYTVVVQNDAGVAASDAPHGDMAGIAWQLRAFTHLGGQTDAIAYGGVDSTCTFAVTNSYELPGCPLTCATDAPTVSPTSPPQPNHGIAQENSTMGSDEITYRPGELTVMKEGLILSTGLDVRIIARSGEVVQYLNRNAASEEVFHDRPDAAGVFAVPESHKHLKGGWIYVSNSEVGNEKGGVGSLFFDGAGNVVKYRKILEATSDNCGGGKTDWGTWISCEEKDGTRDGAIWEVDPFGRSAGRKTILGGKAGGSFESFASDVRNRDMPRFFVTEDYRDGALRRFTPAVANWTNPQDMLHSTGTMEYLVLRPLNESTTHRGSYTWTTNFREGKRNAEQYFRNTEGISVHDNALFFVSKKQHDLFELNLDDQTWKKSSTKSGLFSGSPDQLVQLVGDGDLLYFTEEGLGGDSGDNGAAGVHARDNQGRYFTILESHVYHEETTGLAFSPNAKHLYVAYQKNGLIFDVWRKDGGSFGGREIDVKYHATETTGVV